ncbi:polygalacturonase-like [Macadamia integrifolia]|uniref:polygalacturonase-like n=1 Tax=Macadamia integrifolia TaxID=60698 RepID=UPI001C52CE6E|nr:polygalacturonase-like [Macadamia integrifolia]
MVLKNCLDHLLRPLVIFFFFFFIFFHHLSFTANAEKIINIESLGAKGDGTTDSSPAMLQAWEGACKNSTEPTTIIVPSKKYFLSSAKLDGPCTNKFTITFQMEGSTLIAPDYTKMSDSKGLPLDYWVIFQTVQGVSLIGGALEAQGKTLWDCKGGAASAQCPPGATSLAFFGSKDVKIQNLTSNDAKLYHIVIHSSLNVTVEGGRIEAPGDSPNTDGIHVQNSTQVRVDGTTIMTGDDCISIGPATRDLHIEGVNCGPGHGISIGSLGKDAIEEGVEGVVVMNSTFTGSTNGVRIKSWARPSTAFVRGVIFQKIIMNNVINPIIIDQNYCPHNIGCPPQTLGNRTEISNVTYTDITGTSASEVAVNFNCSVTPPCKDIKLQDINLNYIGGNITERFCLNAYGSVLGGGIIKPPSCLKTLPPSILRGGIIKPPTFLMDLPLLFGDL